MKSRGLILAGGRGSRLEHLTDNRPKAMVSCLGRPLLEFPLNAMRRAGLDQIALVSGYRREDLEGYQLPIFHNARWESTSIVRGLMMADPWLREATCVISYGDLFYNADFIQALLAAPGDIALASASDWRPLWEARFGDPLLDAVSFRLSDQGDVSEIGSRPASVEEVQGQYFGLFRISPAGWRQITAVLAMCDAAEIDGLDMTSLFSLLIRAGVRLTTASVQGAWGEVDSETDRDFYEMTYAIDSTGRVMRRQLPA